MIVIDSSGWMHYFMNGELAEAYSRYMTKSDQIITPTIVLYEVYKKIKKEFGDEPAFIASSEIEKTHLVSLTHSLAMDAASVSIEHKLAMADSIIYATANLYGAKLVTSDADFKDLPGVSYISVSE